MRERPILFQGEMVRAILDGQKTQTRRVIKPQPEPMGHDQFVTSIASSEDPDVGFYTDDPELLSFSPFGCAGDRLWVRETFGIGRATNWTYYRAHWGDDGKIINGNLSTNFFDHWKPSIFMPRERSRIMLEVLKVRVERLQDISEEDALAEGIDDGWLVRVKMPSGARVRCYRELWNSINLHPKPIYETNEETGKRVIIAYRSLPWSLEDFADAYPSAASSNRFRGLPLTIIPNPWVWVVEFKRIKP